MNTTTLARLAIDSIEEFELYEPYYLLNLADFLCAFTAAFYLRFRDKDAIRGIPLCICTFLMCFGGSSVTNFLHGLMMGYMRRSTSFASFLAGLISVQLLPQSLIDQLFPTSIYQIFNFFVDCLLRVHCVTSWGVDTAIFANGSVVSATIASMATGCFGGMMATLLLDRSSSVWIEKISTVLMRYKNELEHLLTLSLVYQILIGFIPLSVFTPIDRLTAKSICFGLFLLLHVIERITGIRLFLPIPMYSSLPSEKEKKESRVCYKQNNHGTFNRCEYFSAQFYTLPSWTPQYSAHHPHTLP